MFLSYDPVGFRTQILDLSLADAFKCTLKKLLGVHIFLFFKSKSDRNEAFLNVQNEKDYDHLLF